jgi:hypothetical protein
LHEWPTGSTAAWCDVDREPCRGHTMLPRSMLTTSRSAHRFAHLNDLAVAVT